MSTAVLYVGIFLSGLPILVTAAVILIAMLVSFVMGAHGMMKVIFSRVRGWR